MLSMPSRNHAFALAGGATIANGETAYWFAVADTIGPDTLAGVPSPACDGVTTVGRVALYSAQQRTMMVV